MKIFVSKKSSISLKLLKTTLQVQEKALLQAPGSAVSLIIHFNKSNARHPNDENQIKNTSVLKKISKKLSRATLIVALATSSNSK